MNILKESTHNFLMGFSWVSSFAKRYHRTGLNEDIEGISQIIDFYSQGVNLDGADILEIGPGQTLGVSTTLMKKFGSHQSSVDITRYFSDEECLSKGIQYKIYNGVDLPFQDHSFDCIISSDVFEHVRKPRELLLECRRVLRPQGVFKARIDLRDHFYLADQKKWHHCRQYSDKLWWQMTSNRSNFINRLLFSQWSVLFHQAGFHIKEIRVEKVDPTIFIDEQYLKVISADDLATWRLDVSLVKSQ